jgi:hypothetical protein
MLNCIPLNLSAFDREPNVESWVKSWASKTTKNLEPKDWFAGGHNCKGGEVKSFWSKNILPGVYVWSPPPAAAEVALEELR